MDELPDWPDGTVTTLATAGDPPHAIPVSTAIRTGPRTIFLALAATRTSLARLRDGDPHVALTVLATDVAFTAHATATIIEPALAEVPDVAAIRLDVADIQDHRRPRFAIQAGVRWRWIDDEAEARDRDVRAGLRRLAGASES